MSDVFKMVEIRHPQAPPEEHVAMANILYAAKLELAFERKINRILEDKLNQIK